MTTCRIAVTAAFLLVLSTTTTRAYSSGTSGASGEAGSGTSCIQCHGSNAPAPTVTVTGLPSSTLSGGTVSFSITIHRANATGATGACAGTRCAALEVSTNSAGTFVAVANSNTQVLGSGADTTLTHTARTAFDANGDVVYPVQLTNLQAGARTLFIAANDVDGNRNAAGDRVALLQLSFTVVPDRDGDNVLDANDNCPTIANTNQLNSDGDAPGDACDNCPAVPNADQANLDGDGSGDVCDDDDDNDGFADAVDNCPRIANATQANLDADAQGDACDDDIDGDTLTNAAEQLLGTRPDDADTDDDGVRDDVDPRPLGDCFGATTIGAACSVGVGACAVVGAFACGTDGSTVVCNAVPLPPATTVDDDGDGIDDDCDGAVDEDVIDVPGEGEGEGEGEGVVVVAEGEGEGVVVVAEGEGEGVVVAEGEGEGVVAEGEGEGEQQPIDAPVGDDGAPDAPASCGSTASSMPGMFWAIAAVVWSARRRRQGAGTGVVAGADGVAGAGGAGSSDARRAAS